MQVSGLQLTKARACPSSAAVGLASGLHQPTGRACQGRGQPCQNISLCSASTDFAQQWWDEGLEEAEDDLDAADLEALGELPDDLEVQGLERLQETLESEFPLSLSEDDAESREFALALAKVAADTSGQNIVVMHIAPLVSWASYLVVATVTSSPALGAILAKAEMAAKQNFDRRPSSSSATRSPWEVLDFGDVCLHVFSAEERAFYNLEGFYEDAPRVDVSHLLAGPKPTQPSSLSNGAGGGHPSAWSIKQPL